LDKLEKKELTEEEKKETKKLEEEYKKGKIKGRKHSH
jgi:hypothetical protein